MENVTRTAAGSELQTFLTTGVPFVLKTNTTLNEKFSVLAGTQPTKTPTVKYFCIGNGGHSLAAGSDGTPLIDSVPHKATNTGLYKFLPFILRATNNDIDATTQAKYAMRTVVTVGGIQYYAYYLKRLDLSAATVSTVLQTVSNGVTSTTNYVPGVDDLSPTPPNLSGSNVSVLSSQYLVTSCAIPISFTAQECTELLNAATILFGDPKYAIISEIGLCSGEDHSITLAGGSTFMEVVAAQITSFINTAHIVQFTASGISGALAVGANEPLLVLT
jgi:hypothetical protein